MKKHIYYLATLFIFCSLNNFLTAQEIFTQKKTSKIAYAEKIYLQLNSTVFTSDQTIWFKAVVTDVNQRPTVLSKVLYVDLINFDKRIVSSKILKLENGITDGFFDLQEITPLIPGKYMIRAYTKWNLNFKEKFVSKQYIDIFRPTKIKTSEKAIRNIVISENDNKQLELSAKVFPKVINPKFKGKLKIYLTIDDKKDSIIIRKNPNKEYTFKYLLPKNSIKAKIDVQLDSIKIKNFNYKSFNSFSKTIAIDKNFIDVQFFPEGGKLIDGLTSIIGFKALDYKNEGIQVNGIIRDNSGLIVTEFKSNQLGMGFYQLKPNKDKTYYAEVSVNTLNYKFELPIIHKKGYALVAKSFKDLFKLQIQSNFTKTDSLFIRVQSRGIIYNSSKVKCKNGRVNIGFKKNLFPEGIVTFTVFNNVNQPICERLVFNYKEHSSRLKINTNTNKKNYTQREKVILKINVNDSLQASKNTSLLVLNKEQLGNMQLKRTNILSYFLLESELKGKIEQPNFYFDKNNKHRFYAMDALLLTQGWRNYIFKPTEEKIEFKQQPEKGLQISGTIEEYTKRKRKKPLQLTLMAKGKKDIQANVTTMDSLGRFSFELNDTYNDDLEYLIQTKNHRGRKKALTINIDKSKPLKVNFKKQEILQLAEKHNSYVIENRKRFVKENPFKVDENGFVLDEIIVKTRLLSPIQEKMTKEHGEPDVIIEDKELVSKEEKWMSGLYSLLLFKFPDDVKIIDVPYPEIENNNTSEFESGNNGEKTSLVRGTDLGFIIKDEIIINIVDFTFQKKPPLEINADSFSYAHIDGSLFTFVIVDGEPVHIRDYHLISNIPIEELKSVEIIKNPKYQTKYLDDVFNITPNVLPNFSFINIYTHTGRGFYAISNTKGIYKNTLPSFSVKKEFYAPKHENLTKSDWDTPDLRSTVFWKPNIALGKNNTGKVEFYTDDNIGEMLVIIESISNDGKLGYYETTYKVNKRNTKI